MPMQVTARAAQDAQEERKVYKLAGSLHASAAKISPKKARV
jgi:hypothetical protein